LHHLLGRKAFSLGASDQVQLCRLCLLPTFSSCPSWGWLAAVVTEEWKRVRCQCPPFFKDEGQAKLSFLNFYYYFISSLLLHTSQHETPLMATKPVAEIRRLVSRINVLSHQGIFNDLELFVCPECKELFLDVPAKITNQRGFFAPDDPSYCMNCTSQCEECGVVYLGDDSEGHKCT
jgi:hypothetical protein